MRSGNSAGLAPEPGEAGLDAPSPSSEPSSYPSSSNWSSSPNSSSAASDETSVVPFAPPFGRGRLRPPREPRRRFLRAGLFAAGDDESGDDESVEDESVADESGVDELDSVVVASGDVDVSPTTGESGRSRCSGVSDMTMFLSHAPTSVCAGRADSTSTCSPSRSIIWLIRSTRVR